MDYTDILKSLSERQIKFAVAGGFACLAHGVVRVTMDLDLVVEVSDDNLGLLWETLTGLGFMLQQPIPRSQATSAEALQRLSEEKGMRALSWIHGSQPFLVVDILVGPPFRWSEDLVREESLLGIKAPVLQKTELIRLKRAAGRPKDLVDVEELERKGSR